MPVCSGLLFHFARSLLYRLDVNFNEGTANNRQ